MNAPMLELIGRIEELKYNAGYDKQGYYDEVLEIAYEILNKK